MTSSIKPSNRILDAVHETAQDLHDAGFIDQRRLRQYDALCLDVVPDNSRKSMCEQRFRNKLS